MLSFSSISVWDRAGYLPFPRESFLLLLLSPSPSSSSPPLPLPDFCRFDFLFPPNPKKLAPPRIPKRGCEVVGWSAAEDFEAIEYTVRRLLSVGLLQRTERTKRFAMSTANEKRRNCGKDDIVK